MAKVFKGTGTVVAKMAGASRVMDEAAAKVQAKAEGLAASHRKTGHYMDSFSTEHVPGKKGVVDRMVINSDPAALVIEYGHFAEGKDGGLGEFVPGQFILTRAVAP